VLDLSYASALVSLILSAVPEGGAGGVDVFGTVPTPDMLARKKYM
jgi:hypothetical protein